MYFLLAYNFIVKEYISLKNKDVVLEKEADTKKIIEEKSNLKKEKIIKAAPKSQATLAAPYSVRPKPGATVSMPLHWEEVKKGLKMTDFTLKNSIERMRSEGDIFKPVLEKGINMKSVLNKLKRML
jgi:bifunctional non-homologous end joining protein LigD